MTDQATSLRLMAAAPSLALDQATRAAQTPSSLLPESATQTRTIAIASGKGGVGKSNVAVNLALELAALNRRVTLLDADLALANADVLLGLNPQYNLSHVLSGRRQLDEVVIRVGSNFRLIPGGSGVEELANLSSSQHSRLIAELRAMETASDYLIIDSPAGIAHNVTGVVRAATEVMIVTTPDPTAVVDAYATIKVILQHSPTKIIRVVVNDVVGIADAEQIFTQLHAATTRFLGRSIEHLGTIPRDAELADAVREQIPVVQYAPETPASRALRLIAKYVDHGGPAKRSPDFPSHSFWSALTETDV